MTEIAESLYKTSVGRIKVLEKQVEILCNRIKHCPDKTSYMACGLKNCAECWQSWSLKKAEREVKDDTN